MELYNTSPDMAKKKQKILYISMHVSIHSALKENINLISGFS